MGEGVGKALHPGSFQLEAQRHKSFQRLKPFKFCDEMLQNSQSISVTYPDSSLYLPFLGKDLNVWNSLNVHLVVRLRAFSEEGRLYTKNFLRQILRLK